MATKKLFINPLLHSSENDLHLPDAPASESPQERRTAKKQTFEETHERFSAWMNKDLKRQFLELVAKKGTSKTALLNEAIEALLHKQERKPYAYKQRSLDG